MESALGRRRILLATLFATGVATVTAVAVSGAPGLRSFAAFVALTGALVALRTVTEPGRSRG